MSSTRPADAARTQPQVWPVAGGRSRPFDLARTIIIVAVALVILPASAESSVYPAVEPAYRIELPRDEGSHPAYRTEWWYVTGWLETDGGAPLGFQITFFRTRPGTQEDNPSRFAAKQVLFAHAAISDPRIGKLLRGERAARAGFGIAEAKEHVLDVAIDDWSLRRGEGSAGASYRAVARAERFALDLELISVAEPLLHGQRGFSQKSPEPANASHYYSLPQLQVAGRVTVDGRQRQVRGRAWLDHEWSSTFLDAQTQGWDWIGINLEGGGALMASRMRDVEGRQRWAFGTLRTGADVQVFAPGQIEWEGLRRWRSPRTGIEYPVEWRVRLGDRTIRLRPLMDDQESDTRASTGTIYWEGAVTAFDENDRAIGRGYLELTGYGDRLRL